VGKQTFFKSPQIRKSSNSWAHSAITNPQNFLGCASPRITKPQIFMIYLQIINLQFSTKYCTTLSQNSPKTRSAKISVKCIMCKFELEHDSAVYAIFVRRNSMYVFAEVLSPQITKIGLQVANLQSATFARGPQI
jgi:hypothetical protein